MYLLIFGIFLFILYWLLSTGRLAGNTQLIKEVARRANWRTRGNSLGNITKFPKKSSDIEYENEIFGDGTD